MRTLIIVITLLIATSTVHAQQKKSFHDFKTTSIDGKPVDLSAYKGKKVLVVNVASKCGLTPQYEKLEALFRKYKDRNFVIIGFPANNFLSQEPGTNEEIMTFCKSNYDVTFPMMAKISVKGDDMDPLYRWLTVKEQNGVTDAPVKWNFQKFMIDEQGNFAGFVSPRDSPFDEKIISWIEGSK